METVTLTIDGRPITVDKGKTVLQAAIESGISVPYYCYHPGIGIDGSCRVCIVKIEKMPKLQTSCSTTCADGMVVTTNSDDVVAARAGVFELLLANHPLDCPVCDKGGECPLQDFSYAFGPQQSRMEFPRRVFDGEGVRGDVDFGPTLMLNRQRCIMCTRCARFMRDVDGDAQINVINRGYGSEIGTFEDEGVHSLISGNLMDVCPVGAITTKDYRFKSRPWDNPEAADTICTMCSKGCNTTAWLRAKPEWAKGSRLIRMTPRLNPEVNGYWMCDIGRFGYHWVEGAERLTHPLVRTAAGVQDRLAWLDIVPRLRDRLAEIGTTAPDGIRFLLSAHGSVEELFMFRRLAEELLGPEGLRALTVAWTSSAKAQPEKSAFTVPAVDAPNVTGAALLGLANPDDCASRLAALRGEVETGAVSALYVFNPGPSGSLGDLSWILAARASGALRTLVVQAVEQSALTRAADFVLPGAAWVEKEATFVNDQGRLQGTARAVAPPSEAREDCAILIDLAAALGVRLGYADAVSVRRDIAVRLHEVAAFHTLATMPFGRATAAENWLQASNPSERWKWDFMFQDLPPLKFEGEGFSTNFGAVIPLKEVK